MNLKQALYIKTIFEMGSVSRAAQKLYISQPSLSQMLRQIETELETPLFDRTTKPLRPTYAGERYLHAANVMLNANEILENELREIRNEDSGKLRLGISMQRGAQLLPRVLPGFKKRYPHVKLELREAGSAHLVQLVQDGHVDLALASTEPVSPMLSYHLLEEETIGILSGAGSPLASRLSSGTPIDLSQTEGGSFVFLKAGHNIRVIQDFLFQKLGFRPNIFLETDSSETARLVTVQCGCYMLCSDSYVGPHSFFYPLKAYQNRRHFYACFRREQALPRYTQDFLHMLSDVLVKPDP